MKVVILAGGLGTRLSEETDIRPKPMVEIGGRPILWHVMKTYSHYGYNDFIVCLGYKGYYVKDYFHNYYMHEADVTIDLGSNEYTYHRSKAEPWRVSLIDTGQNTMTGGRIRRIRDHVDKETFMLTYGDGVGDIHIPTLLEFHRKNGLQATVTSVQLSGRFGSIVMDDSGRVSSFYEKPKGDGAWINGGFFVLEPGIFDYIADDSVIWERSPLEALAREHQLIAYKHHGFWRPMDTIRDKIELEELWRAGMAPWKIWND